jgi:hypothetical protein
MHSRWLQCAVHVQLTSTHCPVVVFRKKARSELAPPTDTHRSQVSAELQRSQLAGHCRGGQERGRRKGGGSWQNLGEAQAQRSVHSSLCIQPHSDAARRITEHAVKSARAAQEVRYRWAALTGMHLPVAGSGKCSPMHSMHMSGDPAHCTQFSWSVHCAVREGEGQAGRKAAASVRRLLPLPVVARWSRQSPPAGALCAPSLHTQPGWLCLQDSLTSWQVSLMRPISMMHVVQVPFRFSQARQFLRGHCRAEQWWERSGRLQAA